MTRRHDALTVALVGCSEAQASDGQSRVSGVGLRSWLWLGWSRSLARTKVTYSTCHCAAVVSAAKPTMSVQLSDLSVSRSHCSLQLRDGALVLCDGGGRNPTVVNGQPMAGGGVHTLRAGDEIGVGKTLLSFQPIADKPESGSRRKGTPATKPVRVTMEIGSRELLATTRGMPGGQGERARRHLVALVQIGDLLRVASNRDQLINTACEQALSALSGQRAYLMLANSRGRLAMRAVARAQGADDSTASSVPKDVRRQSRAGRPGGQLRHRQGACRRRACISFRRFWCRPGDFVRIRVLRRRRRRTADRALVCRTPDRRELRRYRRDPRPWR